jgi:hypothetical protein
MEYDPKTGEFSTSLEPRSTKDGISRKYPTRQTRRRRIEKMLQNEFATVDEIRETFVRLKALAFGGIQRIVDKDEGEVTVTIDAKPQFMQMWLDRLIGPVKSDEQIEKQVEKRLAEMLELAEREARRRDDAIDVKPTKGNAPTG